VWPSPLDKYTLIVAEKPDAANRIAQALDVSGKAIRLTENGVSYYVAERGERILVVPALGHLYTVASATKAHNQYPVFDFKWVPRHEAERGARRISNWLQVIAKLSKDAETLIDACDYDIEGSIIGYCILKYACGKEATAKRMKYSTMTREELEKSYTTLLPHLDFNLIEAGLARHEVDWLYGINLSRALTLAVKKSTGEYVTLSTGRVQGPALKFLATRERNIGCFVPTPYWNIKAKVMVGSVAFEAEYEKGAIEVKKEAEAVVKVCKGKEGKIKRIETKLSHQMPPFPFDLGALQSEAYSFFGYTPMRTLAIAQGLYLDALISYPRTSSQKLPPEIGYETILRSLAKIREYAKLAGELLAKPLLQPAEGKKQDPAHPAVYPTGKLPEKVLFGAEKNIWDLIVRRFLAVFGDPATRQLITLSIDISDEKFILRGKHTLEEGWFRFYKPFLRLQETVLPSVEEDQEIAVEKVILEGKFTKPMPRYDQRSLLLKLERENIGTKATRAGIIQTLYDRKYINEKGIVVTELGFEVTDVLRKYCPSVISVEFTRKLEESMNEVQLGKVTRGRILADALEILTPVTATLKDNEKAIGKQLSLAVNKLKLEDREIGSCPTCHTGKLVILHSRKTRKRFVGCTNYFNGTCTTAFPLPQKGYVKPSGKACKSCGWLSVQVWLKGKHPWNLCLNPKCLAKAKMERR
jgi:DNA topoisomerase-1